MSCQLFSETELLLTYFKGSPGVLIDVGAHQGHFSLPFVKKGWKLIAFEPERHNRESLIINMKTYDNVEIIPYAVSDREGLVPFYTSSTHFGIHALKPFHNTHHFAYNVKTVRLDKILKNKVSNITLLKIDIEGADFLALKSLDFSSFNPKVVMVEFMNSRTEKIYGYNFRDMSNYMKEKGYITYLSEWGEIKEYAIEGKITKDHEWIRCVNIEEVQNKPIWGNLIFISSSDQKIFEQIMKKYIYNLNNRRFSKDFIEITKKIITKFTNYK